MVQTLDSQAIMDGVRVFRDDYHMNHRDVLIGDLTNTRLANRLMSDFVTLYHQLNFLKEDNLEEACQKVVSIFQDGIRHTCFLGGRGHFIKMVNFTPVLATQNETSEFVLSMLSAEMTKTIEKESKDIKILLFDREDDFLRSKRGEIEDKKIRCSRKCDNINPMDEYSETKEGFHHLLQLIENHIEIDTVNLSAPSWTRVKMALTILCKTTTLMPEKSHGLSSNQRHNMDFPTSLNNLEVAEYILCSIFDALIMKTSRCSAIDNARVSMPLSTTIEQTPECTDFSRPSETPVSDPTEFDVLFGRGGMTNSHPGNKRFRDIISLHRPDYVRAIKVEKPNVARRIVAAIRGGDPPGRFMKRNPADMMWYDVGNRHATEKTSQALREKSQAEKKAFSPNVSEGDVRKLLLKQALTEARATHLRLSKEGGEQLGKDLDPQTFTLLECPVTYDNLIKEGYVSYDGVKKEEEEMETFPCHEHGVSRNEYAKERLTKVNSLNLPRTAPPNIGETDKEGNIVVTDSDILCGRGGLTNHHKGNKRFRDVVALHRPDYVRATKVQKPAVAKMIVKAIRNSEPPGRFLKKDSKTGNWIDIGDRRAAEKASQALREKPLQERNKFRTKPDDVEGDLSREDETMENEYSAPESSSELKREAEPERLSNFIEMEIL
jgi:hypothetical protein